MFRYPKDILSKFECGACHKEKDWSQMNSITLCKNCWVKKDDKFFVERNKKAWAIRRDRRTDKTKKVTCPWCNHDYKDEIFRSLKKTSNYFYCSHCRKKVYFDSNKKL